MRSNKWVVFELLSTGEKTNVWGVNTKDENRICLGLVKWFAPWRQYAFFPAAESIFEKQCLRDIADYCEQVTQLHREAKRNGK